MRVERLKSLAWIFALFVVVLIARLFQLQVLQAERWEREARISRLEKATLPFRRGRILDRQGVVLAVDRPSYDLYFRYRDFRRGHIYGQLLESLLLHGLEVEGGLVAVANQGEAYGEALLQLSGSDLMKMSSRTRGDFLFYLEGACQVERGPLRDQLRALVEAGDPRSLVQALPQLRDRLYQALAQAGRSWHILERTLGPEWTGLLLTKLEERRRTLDLMVSRAVVQSAAARALDQSPSSLRRVLAQVPLSEEPTSARIAVSELMGRWQLDGHSTDFAELLLARGEDAPERNPQAWLPGLRALEAHVRQVMPTDIAGLRKQETQRIHHLRVVSLVRDLSFDQVDLLAQQAKVYPGLYLQNITRRLYPEQLQPLLLGSVRLPSADDLANLSEDRNRYAELGRMFYRSPAEEAEFRQLQHRQLSNALRPDESKGADGVELVYEKVLRGQRGYLQLLKGGDEGLEPLELQFFSPQDGADVVLALDAALEKDAQLSIARVYQQTLANLRELWPNGPEPRAFRPDFPKVGMVLMDLENGETPLLTSVPTLSRQEVREQWNDLATLKQGSPLRQRAIGGGFHLPETPYPGSTFKAVTAAAALDFDSGLWNRAYECLGAYSPFANAKPLHCDARYGHNVITMRDALKKSCNIYFYKLAEEIGAEVLESYSRRLGFGHATGIELVRELPPEEEGGDSRWVGSTGLERGVNRLSSAEDMSRDRYLLMRVAIGQQGIQASPLQMARFYAWLATGKLYQPRLVRQGAGASPAMQPVDVPVLAERDRRRIIDALSAVCEERGGTAHLTGFPSSWGIVGKTGTAQIRQAENPIPTHAWFTGFFPRDNPRYAFAVLCENTGLHGGQIASFVLKDFLESESGQALLGVAQ